MDKNNKCPTQMDYYLVGRECINKDGTPAPIEKCQKKFDNTYINVGKKIINCGQWIENKRTGKNCLVYIGDMMKFNLRGTNAFPILTTKKMNIKPIIAELLGFLKGYDNAEDFRKEGCSIWDANANENEQWLNNPNRKGLDDLGRIYGVQARRWKGSDGKTIDQLSNCIQELKKGNDNRRLIVTHWNPSDLDKMALPPCHLLYNFSIVGEHLDLTLYQRSCDFPIGIPFNIASYCLLLKLVANITRLKAGTFNHFMNNIHIYEDQFELFKEQLTREPKKSPILKIPDVKSLEELENNNITVDDFSLEDYDPHPAIKYPFSV